MPNKPEDGDRQNPTRDEPATSDEGTDTETPKASHHDIIQSAINDGDLDAASRFGAMAAPLVPGGRDDAQISLDDQAEVEAYWKKLDEWRKKHERLDEEQTLEDSSLSASTAGGFVTLTLPDGSVIHQHPDGSFTQPDGTPLEGDAILHTMPGAHHAQPIVLPDPELLPQPWWRVSKPLRWAAVGVLTVALVATVANLIGDSGESEPAQSSTASSPVNTSADAASGAGADTTSDPASTDEPTEQSNLPSTTSESASDPLGDFEPAWEDSAIDPDLEFDDVSGQDVMSAADLKRLDVTSNAADSETAMTVAFYGNARDIGSEEVGTLKSRSLSMDVLISRPGERVLNVLYRADGKIKISDIPPGMAITSEWLTPDELLIVITGLALTPGTQVEAYALIEAYGGFMADVVSLLISSS